MVFTKKQLRQWDKEDLINKLIDFQKANNSLAKRIIKAGDYLERNNYKKCGEQLTLN